MVNYTKKQDLRAKFSISHNADIDLADKPILMTGEGFFCFQPWLGEKKPNDEGNKSMYEVAFAMPKSCPAFKALHKLIVAITKETFGKERNVNYPLKCGTNYIEGLLANQDLSTEEREKIEDTYGNLRDHVYFNAKSQFLLNDPEKPERPDQLLDVALRPVDGKDVNGGDIARISIAPYLYRKKGNKGIALGLRACQILAKGSYSSSGSGDAAKAFTADEDQIEDDAAGAFIGGDADDEPSIGEGFDVVSPEEVSPTAEELAAEEAAEKAAKVKWLAEKAEKAEKAKKTREARAAKKKADEEAAEALKEEPEEDDGEIGDSMFG